MKYKKIILAAIILLIPLVAAAANLEVEIPQEYHSIEPGTKLIFTTKLLQLTDIGRRDVTLKYEILNQQNQVVLTKSETVAVQTQASFVGNIDIPASVEEGTHSLKVTLISETEQNPEALATFSILSESSQTNSAIYIYAAIIAIIVVFLVLILIKSKTWTRKARLKGKIKRIVRRRLNSSK
jgi:hypothetical protein